MRAGWVSVGWRKKTRLAVDSRERQPGCIGYRQWRLSGRRSGGSAGLAIDVRLGQLGQFVIGRFLFLERFGQ